MILRKFDGKLENAIIERACSIYGVSKEALLSKTRTKKISEARNVAMMAVRRSGLSWPETGRVFKKDHSTVIKNCKALAFRASQNKELRTRIDYACGDQKFSWLTGISKDYLIELKKAVEVELDKRNVL